MPRAMNPKVTRPGIGCLPNQVFFTPRHDFLRWLSQYVGSRMVVDCGAGVGHFAARMHNAGILVTALDIVPREEPEFEILPLDAATFPYRKRALPILARPCGGAWVHRTIEHALQTAGRIMYIGLERNFERDLTELPVGAKKMKAFGGRPVGLDEERAFIIFSDTMDFDVETWCLIQQSGYQSKWWWEDGGDWWINTAGGRCPKDPEDIIFETEEVTSLYDLDWTKTSLIDPTSETGWLGPDGTFWGCDAREHNFVAKAVMKLEPHQTDDEGWIKVVGKNQAKHDRYDYFCSGTMTEKQKVWLLDHGYKGWELEERELPRTATLKVPGVIEPDAKPRKPKRNEREGD